jgi:Ca-activated chloride channel family protein
MSFADPWFLLLLVPVAALALRLARRPPGAVDGGSEHVLGRLPRTWRTRTLRLGGVFALLATALLVVALARPLKGREESRIHTEGIDVVLAVDTSSSMLNASLAARVTNLDVVKAVVTDFVAGRDGDRIGLVTFASYPRTESPLTLDRGGLLARIEAVECVRRNSEEDGTAIGVALGQAARKLMDSDASSRVVVLLTDGEENRWTVDPLEAAELCKDQGIKVYTIGAGRPTANTPFGVREVPFDTTLLEQIAQITGGRFFRAHDAAVLRDVYTEIDRLERTRREDIRYTEYEDLYPWALVPALALLVLELLLRRGVHLEFAS